MSEIFENLTEADLLLLDAQTPIPAPKIRWQRASCDFVKQEYIPTGLDLGIKVGAEQKYFELARCIRAHSQYEMARCGNTTSLIQVFMPDGDPMLLCQAHFDEHVNFPNLVEEI